MSEQPPIPGPPAGDAPSEASVDEVGLTTLPSGAAVATEPVGGRRALLSTPRPAIRATIRGAFAGMTAVGVKELRGRMRGRRAFVIVTVYLLLLAGFTWMIELILERRYAETSSGAAYSSAPIGQGIFVALMMLETLLVVALAPAFTAGSISMEREKQTLDMLATTPVSSLSIVIGKLVSALTYLFILILASVPLTAIVFLFGGVAPDDVVRGYAILIATALGLGSLGLFFSALLKRTQAATIATYFALIAVTLGSFFVFYFWNAMTSSGLGAGVGPLKGRPPEAINYLNPYFAQVDVACGVENGNGDWCGRIGFVTDRPIIGVINSQPDDVTVVPPVLKGGVIAPTFPLDPNGQRVIGQPVAVQQFGVVRDSFWPKSVTTWILLSLILILASVRLVSPARQWRPRLPRFLRPTRRESVS